MYKTIKNVFVLSTILTAGLVIGNAFAEDAAPAAQPMETAQATTPEAAAKTEPVKVDDAAAPAAPAAPAADASASAPASPATTPAAPASPAPEASPAAPAAAPAEGHK